MVGTDLVVQQLLMELLCATELAPSVVYQAPHLSLVVAFAPSVCSHCVEVQSQLRVLSNTVKFDLRICCSRPADVIQEGVVPGIKEVAKGEGGTFVTVSCTL